MVTSTLSTREEQLFNFLVQREGSPVTTDVLVKLCYGEEPPVNAYKIIANRISIIEKKLNLGSNYNLCKSKRAGPHPIKIWLEPRVTGSVNV